MKLKNIITESFVVMQWNKLNGILQAASEKGKEEFKKLRWAHEGGEGIPMFKVDIKLGIRFPNQKDWQYVDLT